MRRLRIHLPGGGCIDLDGTLCHVDLGGDVGFTAGVLLPRGELALLDPRAVVMSDGAVVFEPRFHDPARLAPWVRCWLAEHPEWPRIVTEAA